MSLPAEEFMAKFQELKRRVNSNPQNVVWMARNDSALEELVARIFELDYQITKAIVPEKVFANLPPVFPSLYREYHRKYHGVVLKASESLKKQSDEAFIKLVEDNLENFQQALRNMGIDPCAPDEFDPMEDDPVREIENIFCVAQDMIDADFGKDMSDSLNKGISAWDFLCDKIGINLDEIWRRWQAVPITFIPKHVSDQHGHTEIGSLYEQLREAHRAYAFGCEAAAITLCRALMELVLRKHYGCEGDRLEDIISFAEQKFLQLRSMKLQEKRIFANRILHDRTKIGELSAEQVRSFLETVKTLIERAPREIGTRHGG